MIGERANLGSSDWGVIVLVRAIWGKGISEQVIGERANLGASDWGVIEKNNTVRNECEQFFFDTPCACDETL